MGLRRVRSSYRFLQSKKVFAGTHNEAVVRDRHNICAPSDFESNSHPARSGIWRVLGHVRVWSTARKANRDGHVVAAEMSGPGNRSCRSRGLKRPLANNSLRVYKALMSTSARPTSHHFGDPARQILRGLCRYFSLRPQNQTGSEQMGKVSSEHTMPLPSL